LGFPPENYHGVKVKHAHDRLIGQASHPHPLPIGANVQHLALVRQLLGILQGQLSQMDFFRLVESPVEILWKRAAAVLVPMSRTIN